jgi:hypothetical protein
MVSPTRLARLAERIEAVGARVTAPRGPTERWIVDGDRAWQLDQPDEVIAAADLEARPLIGWLRVVRVIVHPPGSKVIPQW